jgi:hypothetical protein
MEGEDKKTRTTTRTTRKPLRFKEEEEEKQIPPKKQKKKKVSEKAKGRRNWIPFSCIDPFFFSFFLTHVSFDTIFRYH